MTLSDAQAIVRETNLRHVAIIMDGNRRWAKKRFLPTLVGHRQGVESLKKVVRHAQDVGLEALSVYAFSTENWNRSADEVDYLLSLFIQAMRRELDELHANGVRIRFIGDISMFPPALYDVLAQAVEKTRYNKGLQFQVAANYGGRSELTRVMQHLGKAIESGELAPSAITEEMISDALDTGGLPDPDLLIRTGGESRLSNFLLWQCAYAEWIISDVLWPDFSPGELDDAIQTFATRQRRYGR
jgi:undecaprenyl diphosphate synthase